MTEPRPARARVAAFGSALGLVLALAHPEARAQGAAATGNAATGPSVQLAGHMGSGRALLVIDGQTQVLAVGASARGVSLLRLDGSTAQVRIGTQTLLLHLGESPARLSSTAGGGSSGGEGQVLRLPRGPGGHHTTTGQINGRRVEFIVDTGATAVTLSQAEADRVGLAWRQGQPLLSHTANGTVPVHSVVISALRLGSVTLANVAAVVVPANMPAVLLGNSALDRFNLQRQGEVLRLEHRP